MTHAGQGGTSALARAIAGRPRSRARPRTRRGQVCVVTGGVSLVPRRDADLTLQLISSTASSFRCSIFHMAVTFDPEKNARNIAERGLSFERVAELEWDTAVIAEDTSRDYGEPRLLVMARLDGRLPARGGAARG